MEQCGSGHGRLRGMEQCGCDPTRVQRWRRVGFRCVDYRLGSGDVTVGMAVIVGVAVVVAIVSLTSIVVGLGFSALHFRHGRLSALPPGS